MLLFIILVSFFKIIVYTSEKNKFYFYSLSKADLSVLNETMWIKALKTFA